MRCCFNSLIECLDGRLDADRELEVFTHIERCDVCFEAIFELVRERNLQARYAESARCSSGTLPQLRQGSRNLMRRSDVPATCGRRGKRILSRKSRAANCRGDVRPSCGS